MNMFKQATTGDNTTSISKKFILRLKLDIVR